jgi:hypothetical protein
MTRFARLAGLVLTVGMALLLGIGIVPASAATHIRIMPPDGGVIAAGQQFDIRVEAESDSTGGDLPRKLVVLVNGRDITSQNLLEAGPDG